MEKIGLDEVPLDFREDLGKYSIISEHRCFSNGWVSLLEIIPSNCEDSVGYANTKNPSWVEVQGTRTVNLPPDGVIAAALLELDNYLMQNTDN